MRCFSLKFNQMTDEQKTRMLIAMYFLYKGAHHISRLQGEFQKKDSKEEIKDASEKRLNLYSSIAKINNLYLYSEDKTEDVKIAKAENEMNEWIEDNGFTKEIKAFFSKHSIMFS